MGITADSKDSISVSFELLEDFMRQCLENIGIPQADAAIVADILIESDRRGVDSHGIGRLKPIYLDRIDAGILNPVTKIDVIKEQDGTAVLDANNGMGHVVAKKAMQMAIKKASRHGLGMVVVRNSSHFGFAGYYASMAIEAGMIGLLGTNARPSIAPTNGVENMLGTNPIVFGFPTDEEFPFLLDCATSVTQRGEIEVYSRAGKSIPEGWVIGRDGKSRTDTDQILKDLNNGLAALTPLGGLGENTAGYKGYGYAIVVEVLSSALQNGQFLKALSGVDENGNKIPYRLGHYFIAIDIEHFIDLNLFKKISGSIMRQLRQSRKAPNSDRIYTPGEKEYLKSQIRKKTGCPISPALQDIISECIKRWDIKLKFPWMKD